MKPLKVGVLRMAAEGQAIAKAPGSDRVIFVPYGVPGDELEVELGDEKRSFASARIVRVLKPGPGRRTPPCKLHFDAAKPDKPSCGGCDWQQFDEPAQLRFKREMVEDCVRRIGKFADVDVHPTKASPQSLRYRNKVQVPFGLRDGKLIAGFYQTGSHDIVDFDDCLVQPELSVKIVRKVKALARELEWRPYDLRTHSGWLRHLFIRTNADGKALVAFVTNTKEFIGLPKVIREFRDEFPEVVSLFQNVQTERTSVILGPFWRKLWGADAMEETIGLLRLAASPGAFLQVNTGATEVLYATAEDALLFDGFKPETLLDLYSGVGAIALWLAPKVGEVIGVEEVGPAVTDANENARRNGITNARFIRAKTEEFLRHGLDELKKPAAAVLDPPRSGCEPHVLRALSRLGLSRVVYVSCNPATFARDARILADTGYDLLGVQPVDLFPQTSHIELVALFDARQ